MVEEFSDEARPTATGVIGPLVRELDGLLWGKKLAGQVPQRWLDTFASDYATRLIAVLARIGERLREEKQKLSALDFDDLQTLTLKLLDERPEVLSRAANRYRFFLIDEVQDTNTIQRDLTKKLALGTSRQANLFIVGDPKQSIYGFRGADVDVFRELTEALEARGGASIPLNLNFRSQPPLIDFFNLLFSRIFKPPDVSPEELNELGFVQHEPSEAKRESLDELPLVEMLFDLREGESEETPRERDARQLTRRIKQLVECVVGGGQRFQLCDIALLFRAMTEAWVYEAALRRAGIPYVTVQGKGFYEREEISDLVQLLRFLDNKTDELALAAVLRSPLCGISDDGLLALRCAPAKGGRDRGALRRRDGVRRLVAALERFEEIDYISPDELPALFRARSWLAELAERRQRYGLSELLRWAVASSEFRTVIASAFDGSQRLANVEKLLVLAERFEQSGAHITRDFVRFIRDFAAAGGRESEGRIDDSADAVRLMTIHQAKGLEFPVVILPELHRQPDVRTEWYLLDRHRGLTIKVPDGRGWRVAGHTMLEFRRRVKLRDQFESMRLLYVGATRARDRLIMSGAGAPKDLEGKRGTWLIWIAQALGLDSSVRSSAKNIEGTSVRVAVNLIDEPAPEAALEAVEEPAAVELTGDLASYFPLLNPIEPDRPGAIHRFSVTQLINFGRCPRQYYFDRVLHAPTGEEMAIWNDAEAPEPPANLTATLRGAVIHRFCESYSEGEPTDCLRASLDYVLRLREAELGDRVATMDRERAIRDLEPLALNYLNSNLRQRVELTREASAGREGLGVLSELRFRLRRPLGILTGTIDKLLVKEKTDGLSVEIIDFKTNRFRSTGNRIDQPSKPQMSFSFLAASRDGDLFLAAEADSLARDYELQMQSYALAAYDLIPGASDVAVTLHFLHPGIEKRLTGELLDRESCASAIDNAMSGILSSKSPESFEARPAQHCRVCSFREICIAGRNWLADTE
jgi:ATP-dependent helicase/nuclease subunit A